MGGGGTVVPGLLQKGEPSPDVDELLDDVGGASMGVMGVLQTAFHQPAERRKRKQMKETWPVVWKFLMMKEVRKRTMKL